MPRARGHLGKTRWVLRRLIDGMLRGPSPTDFGVHDQLSRDPRGIPPSLPLRNARTGTPTGHGFDGHHREGLFEAGGNDHQIAQSIHGVHIRRGKRIVSIVCGTARNSSSSCRAYLTRALRAGVAPLTTPDEQQVKARGIKPTCRFRQEIRPFSGEILPTKARQSDRRECSLSVSHTRGVRLQRPEKARINPVGKHAVAVDAQIPRAEPVSNVIAATNQGVEPAVDPVLFFIVHVENDPGPLIRPAS